MLAIRTLIVIALNKLAFTELPGVLHLNENTGANTCRRDAG